MHYIYNSLYIAYITASGETYCDSNVIHITSCGLRTTMEGRKYSNQLIDIYIESLWLAFLIMYRLSTEEIQSAAWYSILNPFGE